jgi:alpha-mannosidase
LEPAPVRHVVFDTGSIDGFGWSTFTVVEGDGPPGPVTASATGLANEAVQITIDGATGTYAIDAAGLHLEDCGRLVDGGDGGDTYNYSPPATDLVVDRPQAVWVEVLEPGPVRGRVLIESVYELPASAEGDERACSRRSEDTVRCTVRTTLELRTGERFLRVAHDIDNQARDHRLRVHFPLPNRVEGSDAECAFTVVRRGLTAEGGIHEYALPTFPSRRFVDASDGNAGLALLHDGLLEYEVTNDGKEIALTLLRATGYLSRTEPSLRPNPAGPPQVLHGPQLLGAQRAEYAVLLHRGDWRAADCYGAADELLVPLERTRVSPSTTRTRPASGTALRVDGAEVSAVTRVPSGALQLRVFRTESEAGPVSIDLGGVPARGFVVDLRGEPQHAFEGEIALAPWQIATLQLRPE